MVSAQSILVIDTHHHKVTAPKEMNHLPIIYFFFLPTTISDQEERTNIYLSRREE